MYVVIFSNSGNITPHTFNELRDAIVFSDGKFNELWNTGFHLINGYKDYSMHFANPLNTDEKINKYISEHKHWYAWRMVAGHVSDSYCCIVKI